ncbi:hypothetical protein AVEN_122724-1 [Araneus ventricosus]|uniref:Uncharacterized protein n=1 Tax=Araneus ventricosus TaxID=182803 RepID=A0A4Y2HC03_ARAVE|nr:hypothetical protein AVEN_122724-1 [Araneus ventricosus]
MCIVVSFRGCGTITKGIKTLLRGSGRQRIATTVDDLYLLQCGRRRRTLTARQLASQLCCWKGLYPAKLYHADCMKDCSHDDLLCAFVPSARQSEVALFP